MDERFPKYLRVILRKLDFISIPNLGTLVAALAALGFVGLFILNAPMERFVFDPELIRAGEWWRLFSFPISSGTGSPIWYIFYILFIYFVMNGLEGAWGPGPLTIFTLFSYVMAMTGAFVTNQTISVWYYVLENVGLAFGTLFPQMEFYIFFVLPVKAKWVTLFMGAVLIFQFVMGGMGTKILLLIALCPYMLFFGPMLVSNVRGKWRIRQNRRRFRGE